MPAGPDRIASLLNEVPGLLAPVDRMNISRTPRIWSATWLMYRRSTG